MILGQVVLLPPVSSYLSIYRCTVFGILVAAARGSCVAGGDLRFNIHCWALAPTLEV